MPYLMLFALAIFTGCVGLPDYQTSTAGKTSPVMFHTDSVDNGLKEGANSVSVVIYKSAPECLNERCEPGEGQLFLVANELRVATGMQSGQEFVVQVTRQGSSRASRSWCEIGFYFRPLEANEYAIESIRARTSCSVRIVNATTGLPIEVEYWGNPSALNSGLLETRQISAAIDAPVEPFATRWPECQGAICRLEMPNTP